MTDEIMIDTENIIMSNMPKSKKDRFEDFPSKVIISVDNLRVLAWTTDEPDSFEVENHWPARSGEPYSKYDKEVLDQIEPGAIIEFRFGHYTVDNVWRK